MGRIERETVELIHPAGSRRTVLKETHTLGADQKVFKEPNPEIEAMKRKGFMTPAEYKKLKESDIADACTEPGMNDPPLQVPEAKGKKAAPTEAPK